MPESLRLYLDQMIQRHVSDVLSNEGYDVARASDFGQSRSNDREILKKAIDDNRILITLDEHFGDWAVLPLNKHSGVIRLKVNPTTAHNIINLLKPFLRHLTPTAIADNLVILSTNKVKWISTAAT